MIDDDQKIWEIIEKVLYGNPTHADSQFLEKWLEADVNNRKTFETIKKIGLATKIDSPEVKQNVLAKLQADIATEDKSRKISLWRYSAAASIVILIGVGLAFLYFGRSMPNKIAYIETTSPLGVNSSVILSDSTLVHLSPGSTLRYPATFTKSEREVILNGEGYFEVTKDKKHPFIVRTDFGEIKVYGTKFNVKAFKGEKNFITTLLEGSVGITPKGGTSSRKEVMLKPNQQANFDNNTGDLALHDVNAKLYTWWKSGRYYFENQTFASIAKDIERNYNVTLKIEYEELKNEKFSGLLDKQKTVYELLDGLGLYGNFSYVVKNDTIIVQKTQSSVGK